MPESTLTSIGTALRTDTVWVGLKAASSPWFGFLSSFLFVLLGAGIAFGFDLWRDRLRRIQRTAIAWSTAAEQIRIVLDRMNEHLRQYRKTGNLSASELYWVPEIALSFYQTCPDLALAHKVRWIDEIIHQFNFNLHADRHPTALAFADEYYGKLRDAFHEVRSGLSKFVAHHRLKHIIVPAELPARELNQAVAPGGTG